MVMAWSWHGHGMVMGMVMSMAWSWAGHGMVMAMASRIFRMHDYSFFGKLAFRRELPRRVVAEARLQSGTCGGWPRLRRTLAERAIWL